MSLFRTELGRPGVVLDCQLLAGLHTEREALHLQIYWRDAASSGDEAGLVTSTVSELPNDWCGCLIPLDTSTTDRLQPADISSLDAHAREWHEAFDGPLPTPSSIADEVQLLVGTGRESHGFGIPEPFEIREVPVTSARLC